MVSHLNSDHTNPDKVAACWEQIKKAQKITLLTHYKPDGDGVSACAALSAVLEKRGIAIESVYPTKLEMPISRQPANVHINEHSQTPDLIIACDTSNIERLYYPQEYEAIPLINIDHHISNSISGTYNLVDPKATSTCDLLYDLFDAWGVEIDTHIAECLLFGIAYDSQVFHIQSTTAKTLRIAADLMDKGANLFAIKNELLAHKDPAIIRLWGDVMSTIGIDGDKNVAWATITRSILSKHNLTPSSLVGFNNFLAQVSGIDISLLLYETEDGKTKVSLRSKKADVNKIAAAFGGGGHTHASGILSDVPIEQLAQEIIAKL